MSYIITAIVSFVAGAVACHFYYSSALAELAKLKAEGLAEWVVIKSKFAAEVAALKAKL
jgi:hypothetical protein